MDIAGLVAQLQRPAIVELAQAPSPAVRRPGEGQRTLTLTDRQPYTKGSYFAWVAPWNAGTLKEGQDYTETLTLEPDAFPNRTILRWRWPAHPPKTGAEGVYGILGLNFGDYYGTAVQTPIPPRRLLEIAALTQTHAFEIAGATDGFNVLTDYFLTAEPGRHERHLFEIEVFWHTPPYAKRYVEGVEQLGTYTDPRGRAWTVAKNPQGGHGPAILFMPAGGAPLRRAEVDLHAMHLWLVGRGVLTGREWFNGLAFGAEVRQDGGAVTIDGFEVDYR